MGNLQVVEEDQDIHGRKILAGQLRNSGMQGHLVNSLGVFLTNTRVKILKAIKHRLPSYSRFL